MMSQSLPLSVVVPIHDSGSTLGAVLAAIRGTELPRASYEVIVVDDASSDSSVGIAARYADTVVKLTGRASGPAYARNRGAELARGEIIAFVDGDVVVSPDTLPRMLATFVARPDLDAVSASHGDLPDGSNFISQYWNLLLRFGEQSYSGRCAQFAPGCGAVRRGAFLSAGMYDEWRFGTACLENMELGERLLAAGNGVLLSSELKVAHLRRWSFSAVCREVWSRSRLLARSLGYVRMRTAAPSEVVFTLTRMLTPAVALLGTLMLAGAFVPPSYTVDGGVPLLIVLLINLPLHRFYAKGRGIGFAILSAPLHICVQVVSAAALCTGWILRDVVGDVSPDATTQAYSEVGLEVWPPVPRRP
jgi:GT2 family glycosyltransferase